MTARSSSSFAAGARALVAAICVSLLAAAAVDFGFGVGFVSDRIAWATTTYTTVLVVMLIGRESGNPHPAHRVWLRIPAAVFAASLCLWLLRGVLLVELAEGSFVTTGHSPYVVLPVAAVCSLLLLSLLARLPQRSRNR